MTDWSIAAALALATLASEDLATIGAGALVSMRHLDLLVALLAVTVGIYAGDLGLFAAGRLARRAPVVRRAILKRWSGVELASVARRFEQQMPSVILASRFLPGSRLPMYLAAGMLSPRVAPFCLWSLVAVSLWTPMLMGGTLWLGSVFIDGAHAYFAWTPLVGVIVATHVISRLLTKDLRHADSTAS